MQERNALLKC